MELWISTAESGACWWTSGGGALLCRGTCTGVGSGSSRCLDVENRRRKRNAFDDAGGHAERAGFDSFAIRDKGHAGVSAGRHGHGSRSAQRQTHESRHDPCAILSVFDVPGVDLAYRQGQLLLEVREKHW